MGKMYGKLTSGYESPVFSGMTINKNKAIISFEHTDNGLVCNDKQITGFMIAGEDGIFEPGKAQIRDNTVMVTSAHVKKPVAVRYCFDDATIGNLFNKEGLPVAPFRTDRNWSNE